MAKKDVYYRVRGDSGQQRRILFTALILGVLAFVPIGVQLYRLMVHDYNYYARLALKNQTRTTQVTANRGTIYDRNMNILAVSRSVENIYLAPNELKQSKADLEMVSAELARILSADPSAIMEKARNTRLRYQQVAAGVDEEIAAQVREFVNSKGISGIHIEPSSTRYYPYDTLASHVLGFTNTSQIGVEGVEAAYNSFLQGGTGRVITTKGNNDMDMPFSYENFAAAPEGCSLVLTLDATVQMCLEKEMQAAIDRYDVQNGAFGMVMDVNTGAILAMATLGNYDPNQYLTIYDREEAQRLEQLRLSYLLQPPQSEAHATGKEAYQLQLRNAQLKQWRNRCIADGYEPGSTFKVLTMAAALDSGSITLDTPFYCSGSERIPGRSQLLHCWRSTGHGSQKTPQALQNSCNLAFAHIALKMGGETFYDYIQRFGILEKTGIDIIGESKGVFFDRALITDTDKWGTASLTSGSFGQTFKLTPLQLVRAIAAVVNGGNLMEPYLVEQVMDAQGNTVLLQEPTLVRQVIKRETSQTMCMLLQSVVEEGTAKNATVSGFSIGGKTGTSEKIDVFDDKGQPVLDKIVSFVGVAPMDNPRYIVLVALDTPSRKTGIYISGGVMAAPTVGAVMADILPYLGVNTSYAESDPAGKQIALPDFTQLTAAQAQQLLKQHGLAGKSIGDGETVTTQIPQPGTVVAGDSEVLLYFGDPPQIPITRVPDFTGMNRQQASDTAGKAGLSILACGNQSVHPQVVVTAQSERKDTEVPVGSVIELEFTDIQASD